MRPLLLAVLIAGALLAGAFRITPVRTDIAAFLPAGQTPAARLMLDELRQGAAGGVLLVGVEGAPVPRLAAITTAMAARLQPTGLFRLVAAGAAALPDDAEIHRLYARRFMLADAAFDEASLHTGMTALLRALRSSASPVAQQFGFGDPTGAFPSLLRVWAGAAGPVRAIDGAWFDPARDRALLVAATRAGASDPTQQAAALTAVDRAFRDASGDSGARLLISGPAVFAAQAARAIERDVTGISIMSAVLVAGLLVWRFRSLLVLAAIVVPVVLGLALAVLVTGAVFGGVQAASLGLGSAMAGIAVDYPVLLIGHRKRGEAGDATRARIGPAFGLAVATAVLGLGGMVLSGLPGLMQLGAFSAVTLAGTAAATWIVLPRLVVAAGLAPVASGELAWLSAIERVRRFRSWALVPAVLLLALVAARGGPAWETDLAALSPVPAAARAMDQELRAALGAAEAGLLLVVDGPYAEAVLTRQEALAARLAKLQSDGVIGRAEYAAEFLPSAARQTARQTALPAPGELSTRITSASAGLPFQPTAFQPLLDGVAATAILAPLRPADLEGAALGTRLAPLLFRAGDIWRGPVTFRGVTDPGELRRALTGLDHAIYVDVRAELGGTLAAYTSGAWRWLGVCAACATAVLTWGLRRDLARLPRVLGPVLGAVLLAGDALAAAGARLSLVHVVALQLVAGVGFDYALFFSRPQLDAEERARTFRTLVTCNGMTLLTFGALAFCTTPFLHDIGLTVAVGAVLAMAASFLFSGPTSV